MPYNKRRQDCTNKSGEKGTFVTIKKDGGKRQCWKSEEAFNRSVAARHAREADETVESTEEEQLTEKILRQIIRQALIEAAK